ncbi:hypothetical protein D3C71_2199000 [compost metagenome]
MITGASITQSKGKPSINGKMKNISTKPINAPNNVPQAIWKAMRLGFGVAADKPTVAAAIIVMVAPLGQAVATQ